MNSIIEQMKAVFDLMSDKELAQAIAKMYWNIYQELKEVGFSDEQALQIATKFELKK